MASAATSASDKIAELEGEIAAIKAANQNWASDSKLIDAKADMGMTTPLEQYSTL